jgi:cytochrome c biogenesis protein CcdA
MVFAGGVLFGLAPCALAVIPLTIGFVGGYAGGDRRKAFLYSLCFVLGLAITLMALGVAAALMGRLFGHLGKGWYMAIAFVAIAMGLNLLGVFQINLSAGGKIAADYRGAIGAFLLGLLFGVISTPCSTPVLILILALVAAKGQILYGASLLLTYGLGQSLLVLVAGTFTGFVSGFVQSKGAASFSKYFKMASGTILIIVGLYVLFKYI